MSVGHAWIVEGCGEGEGPRWEARVRVSIGHACTVEGSPPSRLDIFEKESVAALTRAGSASTWPGGNSPACTVKGGRKWRLLEAEGGGFGGGRRRGFGGDWLEQPRPWLGIGRSSGGPTSRPGSAGPHRAVRRRSCQLSSVQLPSAGADRRPELSGAVRKSEDAQEPSSGPCQGEDFAAGGVLARRSVLALVAVPALVTVPCDSAGLFWPLWQCLPL